MEEVASVLSQKTQKASSILRPDKLLDVMFSWAIRTRLGTELLNWNALSRKYF